MRLTLKNGILIVVGAIALVLIAPLIAFWGGYLLGFIVKLLIGDPLINGINCICKTDLTKDAIPLITGTLSWVASFFKEYKFNADMKD